MRRFPLVDIGGFRVYNVVVGGIGSSGVPGVGDGAGWYSSAVLLHEAVVVAAPGDGRSGHVIGPGVVADCEHVFVDNTVC